MVPSEEAKILKFHLHDEYIYIDKTQLTLLFLL